MPVIQGGGVTYDAGAAVRDNFKDLTNSMQILAALKQEERKHQLNVMTSALDMLKLAQISSGLPWQVFLGTDLATAPLNAYLQAYSAASGRQLSSNEAQQLVNQLHEFNADQNNWSAQTQAEFLLSRSLWSEEGYNKPPSSTSESAEGRTSTESATEPAVNTYGLPYKGTGSSTETGSGGGNEVVGGTSNPIIESETQAASPSAPNPLGGPAIQGEGEGYGQTVSPTFVPTTGVPVRTRAPIIQPEIKGSLPNLQVSGAPGQLGLVMAQGGTPKPEVLRGVPPTEPQPLPIVLSPQMEPSPTSQGEGEGYGQTVSPTFVPTTGVPGPTSLTPGTVKAPLTVQDSFVSSRLLKQESVPTTLTPGVVETPLTVPQGGTPQVKVPPQAEQAKTSAYEWNDQIKDYIPAGARFIGYSESGNPIIQKQDGSKVELVKTQGLQVGLSEEGQSSEPQGTRLIGAGDVSFTSVTRFAPSPVLKGYPEGLTIQTPLVIDPQTGESDPKKLMFDGFGRAWVLAPGVKLQELDKYPIRGVELNFRGMSLEDIVNLIEDNNAGLQEKIRNSGLMIPLTTFEEYADYLNKRGIGIPAKDIPTIKKMFEDEAKRAKGEKSAAPRGPGSALLGKGMREETTGNLMSTPVKPKQVLGAKWEGNRQGFGAQQILASAPKTPPSPSSIESLPKDTEIPVKIGKEEVTVTPEKVAKATSLDELLKPGEVNLRYTGPKASEEAIRIAKDPVKVSNIFEKLRSVTGQPTKSFKEKSEIHNAAVTAGSWLQTGWNVMTPDERMNLVKWAENYVKNTSPAVGYMRYGSDWATLRANELRDEAQLQAAIASQMSVQASVAASGLSGLLQGIVDIAQTYSSIIGDISVAAINKGKSPSEYLANPKENPAFVDIQNDIRQILDTFFQAGGMEALLGAVKTYQLQGGFIGIGKKYKPAPGTTEGTTLTPEQKAAQEKAAEEAKRIINGR